MLIDETEIRIEMLYMGPGNGCHKIFHCDALGFSRDIDCPDESGSKAAILAELEQLVYRRFLSGEFTFPPPRQQKALYLSRPGDRELIAQAFSEDWFTGTFVRMELMRRNLFDADLIRLGMSGGGNSREQAIELLLQKRPATYEGGE
jgi:hypothetical protein